jgi:hypothetical protein
MPREASWRGSALVGAEMLCLMALWHAYETAFSTERNR